MYSWQMFSSVNEVFLLSQLAILIFSVCAPTKPTTFRRALPNTFRKV